MARSRVNFNLKTSTLGQVAEGNDFISGMPFVGTAPGSFLTNKYQSVSSLADAEAKGITLDYSDETLPKAIYTISGTVTIGDTFEITVTEPNPITESNPTGTTVVSLGTATVTTAATPTGGATDFKNKINEGTYLHGYTATSALGVVTITGPQGIGIALNPAVSTNPLAVTVTGTSTGAITQQFGTGSGGATVGVYSLKSVWHYQVSEFFRANPTGVLWVGFFDTYSAANIVTLSNAAKGAIKQFGVFDITVTSASAFTTNMTALQAQAVTLFSGYNPGIVHYAPNIKAISGLETLENQQTKSNYYVSPVILQDGGAAGAQLFINSGISIINVGCSLGTTSKAAVNQNIGEIGAFNITDDVEMAIPAFGNGKLVTEYDSNTLDQLDSYRYIFATNLPNKSGTFFVNDWSAIVQTSPYYRMSRTRTINKVVRLIYANIVDLLKSQIQLNPDGTITQVSIARFDSAILPVKTQMQNAGEISNMAITISPAQNVVSTGTITIGVAVQPTISADFITVDLSFVANI